MPHASEHDALEGAAARAGILLVASGTHTSAVRMPAGAALGRRTVAGNEVHDVNDERMSREHATVRFERGHWVITDLESRNGTFVNGQRIASEVRRRGDSVLRLGHSVFLLLADIEGHPVTGDATIGPELARAHAEVRRAASHPTLLVQGEPGSGRAVAARLFHEASRRRAGPFVTVACGGLPEGVGARLLFGAKKGMVESIGKFQMASGGTIYLENLGELPAGLQPTLLRLIDRGELEPVGAIAGSPIDVGIVASGSHDLRLAVADRQFDRALYERLAGVTVRLPPLRQRRVDIVRFVQREVAAASPGLAPHAKLIEACLVRQWPRNADELVAAVREAARRALAAGRPLVRAEDLDATAGFTTGGLGPETAVERPRGAAPVVLDKQAIEAALVRANHGISAAARLLGVHRTQLYQLMDEHGIVFTDE